jgi:CheY-like chemotaxis protein/anti-sigma regulatory factor (Ser/Thr protein kinase)
MLSPEKVDHAYETIARNARAQTQLINDLLDASRIITGKLRLELEPVHLVDVLGMAIEALRPAADAKNIRLLPKLDRAAGPILGDASRLQQVVWNLLANAVKFTPRGGSVHIGLRRDESFVELSVEDTGQGIKPAFLPHVFERFRQADSSSDRCHGGLGIGLAIAQHITELHGGTIAVASEGDGRGAKFTVRLPVPPQRVDAASRVERTVQPLERGPLQRPKELEGLRILVVDDEPDAREILTFVLENCKAEVTSASSAAEALEALQRTLPDMIVSDLGMPNEDGLVLIQNVRSLAPDQGGRTPAVALTAYARTEDRTKALNAGFDVHVAKPVHPAELIAVIVELASRLRRT